ncbi:hypothetical protein D3C59_33930 [Streptomyces sp. SHP22-7]|nr:hypothetical protein D3C59_33930 [Streptomyces sp. SHP22-7]
MNVNKAGKADVSARRAALIRLRRKRTPYDSPEILGLGYETAADARKDFYRAVTARRKATEAEVADYREEQNAIFESILDSFIPSPSVTTRTAPITKPLTSSSRPLNARPRSMAGKKPSRPNSPGQAAAPSVSAPRPSPN